MHAPVQNCLVAVAALYLAEIAPPPTLPLVEEGLEKQASSALVGAGIQQEMSE
jgi:hypothetical protein